MSTLRLEPFGLLSGTSIPIAFLIALLVTLIPTTIGGLLSAHRLVARDVIVLVKANVIAKSGRAVEASGDLYTLLRDKTGTITFGNRVADAFAPVKGVSEREVAEAAAIASLADETPERKSCVDLATRVFDIRGDKSHLSKFSAFSAETRVSGADIDGHEYRKGAADAVYARVGNNGQTPELSRIVEGIAKSGGTPLVVTANRKILGVVHLKDIIKPRYSRTICRIAHHGHPVLKWVPGNTPLTAGAICRPTPGVYDFPVPKATPGKENGQLPPPGNKRGPTLRGGQCGGRLNKNDAPAAYGPQGQIVGWGPKERSGTTRPPAG